MPDGHTNFAFSSVATAPSPASSGTTLTVAAGDGALFPAAPFNVIVCPATTAASIANAEIVRCTSKGTGDNWTITRTQEGSAARGILVGDQIYLAVTSKTLTDMENIAAGGLYAPQLTGLALPMGGLLGLGGSSGAVNSVTHCYGVRVIMPKTGVLHDLAIYVYAAAGTVEVGVLDTTATTRNRLYTTGAVAVVGAGAWQIVGDPALAVTQGQHVDFYINASDIATARFARAGSFNAVAISLLPANFLPSPQGGFPKMNWDYAGGATIGATIAEASLASAGITQMPFIMGRVV